MLQLLLLPVTRSFRVGLQLNHSAKGFFFLQQNQHRSAPEPHVAGGGRHGYTQHQELPTPLRQSPAFTVW